MWFFGSKPGLVGFVPKRFAGITIINGYRHCLASRGHLEVQSCIISKTIRVHTENTNSRLISSSAAVGAVWTKRICSAWKPAIAYSGHSAMFCCIVQSENLPVVAACWMKIKSSSQKDWYNEFHLEQHPLTLFSAAIGLPPPKQKCVRLKHMRDCQSFSGYDIRPVKLDTQAQMLESYSLCW